MVTISPKTLDGIVYNKATVQALRETVIEMRDHALKSNAFDWAVALSHVAAVLAYYIEELEE